MIKKWCLDCKEKYDPDGKTQKYCRECRRKRRQKGLTKLRTLWGPEEPTSNQRRNICSKCGKTCYCKPGGLCMDCRGEHKYGGLNYRTKKRKQNET